MQKLRGWNIDAISFLPLNTLFLSSPPPRLVIFSECLNQSPLEGMPFSNGRRSRMRGVLFFFPFPLLRRPPPLPTHLPNTIRRNPYYVSLCTDYTKLFYDRPFYFLLHEGLHDSPDTFPSVGHPPFPGASGVFFSCLPFIAALTILVVPPSLQKFVRLPMKLGASPSKKPPDPRSFWAGFSSFFSSVPLWALHFSIADFFPLLPLRQAGDIVSAWSPAPSRSPR